VEGPLALEAGWPFKVDLGTQVCQITLPRLHSVVSGWSYAYVRCTHRPR